MKISNHSKCVWSQVRWRLKVFSWITSRFKVWQWCCLACRNYSDVIMSAVVSQITGVSIVCSTVCSGAEENIKALWIHRWPVDSPHKGPVTRKMFPFDDVIMHSTMVKHQRNCLFRDWLGTQCWQHTMVRYEALVLIVCTRDGSYTGMISAVGSQPQWSNPGI